MTTKITKEATAFKLPAAQTREEIKRDQDGIRTNLLKLDDQIHWNAVQCLMHAEKHGDTSLMARLLTEIIDEKSGYRRQGLIAWVRAYSPMVLVGQKITLGGVDEEGNKKPFRVAEAAQNPFRSDEKMKERLVPIYQDTLLSPLDNMVKKYLAAQENTLNGKPIDPSKPFFDGVNEGPLTDFVRLIAEERKKLPVDSTREIRLAQERIAKDTHFVQSVIGDKRPEDEAAEPAVPVSKLAVA